MDYRPDQSADAVIEACWMRLDVSDSELPRFARVLNPLERERASRFRHPRDRKRYVVRRGRLRELLAERLDCAPAEVPLRHNHFGKPDVERSDLRFNVSHSRALALYVMASGLHVGCDIEWRDDGLAIPAVAERLFSPGESRALRQLSKKQWAEGFFNCWTRKEAFVKARGIGISFPLDAFEVSLIPGEPAALLRGGAGWSLRSFEPTPGLHAAVVAEGSHWRVIADPVTAPGLRCPGDPNGST